MASDLDAQYCGIVNRLIPKFSLLSANLYRPMKIGMDVLQGP